MKYTYIMFVGMLIGTALFAVWNPRNWWESEETKQWQRHITAERPMFELWNRLDESKTYDHCSIIIATSAGLSDPVMVGTQEVVEPGMRVVVPGIVTKLAVIVQGKNDNQKAEVIRSAQLYEFPVTGTSDRTVYVELKEERGKVVLKPQSRVSFFKNITRSGLSLKVNIQAKNIVVRDLTADEIKSMQKRHLMNLVQEAQTLLEILRQKAQQKQVVD